MAFGLGIKSKFAGYAGNMRKARDRFDEAVGRAGPRADTRDLAIRSVMRPQSLPAAGRRGMTAGSAHTAMDPRTSPEQSLANEEFRFKPFYGAGQAGQAVTGGPTLSQYLAANIGRQAPGSYQQLPGGGLSAVVDPGLSGGESMLDRQLMSHLVRPDNPALGVPQPRTRTDVRSVYRR